MKKRMVSLLLLAVMLIGVLPIMSMTVEAASNPYPTWQTVGGVGTIPCTWYAWQQTYDRLGIALPNWGDAINWYYSAPNSGYSVGTTPRANSIAVWTIDGHGYGHVAFVTAVNGSRMVINEGGRTDATGSNGIVNGQDLPSTVGSSWYGRNLVGFVYLDAAPAPVAPTLTWTDYPDKQYIGTTNAVLARRCDLSGVSTASITKLGISMHNYKDERVASFEETVSLGNYSYFQLWYDVNADLGYTLLPGTYYQYYFWAEINGTIYYSSVYSFLTGGTHTHQYDAGTVTANATCTSPGSKTRTCSTCGHSYTEAIPQKDHNFNNIRYVQANCTSIGYTIYSCSCGASYTDEPVEALGHSYTNACDTSCNRCGAARSITHNYAGATCTAPKTCTVCGVTTGTSLGHTYTNACDASCNRCGVSRTAPHNYTTETTKATFTRYGSIVKKCSACGAVASSTTISFVKDVTLSATSYVYDGKVKTPTVTLVNSGRKTLVEGTDYTVTYDGGRSDVGIYDVTVTLKGNYSGTKKLSFEILPALEITMQPKTQRVEVENDIQLTAKATGQGLSYQWQSSSNGTTWKNCSSSTAKKATFTFAAKTRHNGNYYRCKVTDANGNTIYTNAVRTYVLGVTTQPTTQKVKTGATVKFTVTATGAGKTYQWQVSTNGKTWKNCSSSSATSATFTFTGKTSHSGNYYRCRIKDSGGNTVYTDAVRLYVLGITQQPVKKTVTKGKTAKFTVEATGASKVYQWQVSTNGKTWKNCSSSSATSATFTFTGKTSHNGNYYRCRIKDSGGNTVYTDAVRLYVLGITEQPVSKTVTKGRTAKFTVEATGASKTYQWQVSTDGGKTWKNCSSSSAKKATFTFTSKTTHNGNYYRCRIKDSGGNTVYTTKVKLTVKK